MSDKTQPTYKNTKLGILSIREIEQIIFDNLILVQSFLFRNYETLDFSIETLCRLHDLLCNNLFEQAGKYRIHNVQMGNFEPIGFYEVQIEMKKLSDDMAYRLEFLKSDTDKKEFLAHIMWKLLRIHPFFDYNARVVRIFGELFLLKQWLPIKSFRGKTRKEFAEAMKKWTFEHDLSAIIELIW